MKKLLFIFAFILIFSITKSYAQSLKEGNLIGVHHIEIILSPDITIEQFLNHYQNEYIPASEKLFPGMIIKIAKGLRGENENQIAIFYLFESSEVRDRYFNEDGSWTEIGITANEKMKPYYKALNALGKYSFKYTDWLIL